MDTESKFSPPYNIPWATFLSTVERIAADPPGRVDRSYLDSQSGNIQTYLIAALKGFELIDDESRPTKVLEFADEAKRKALVADMLQAKYGSVVPLGESNTTNGQLADGFSQAFPQITGESRVKAVRFFLGAMAYADLPTSPLWSSVKAARGSSSPRRGKKARTAPPPAASAMPQGERTTVDLGDAGTVTVIANLRWLMLTDDQVDAIRGAIRGLKALTTDKTSRDDGSAET